MNGRAPCASARRIAVEGTGALRPWLAELSRSAPVTVRDLARQALDRAGDQGAGPAAGGTGSSSSSQPPSR